MKKGYVIVEVEVLDPDGYAEYRKQSTAALAQYNGRFLARGGTVEVAEGTWQPKRLVILEFDSLEQAHVWYNSPEYTQAKVLRQKYGISNLVFVEGAE